MDATRFQGRSAIVTGGASGIGRGIAERMLAEGARVSLWDADPTVAEVAAEIKAQHYAQLDVTDPASVTEVAAATAEALDGIAILVASAGITGPNVPAEEYPVEAWKQVIDINLNGVYYCNRAVIAHMRRGGYGRIVNIASIAGKEGNPNASAYSASKAGVIGLTKSLGKELAETEIRVNCITPAAIATPMFSQMTEAHIAFMLSKIPMKRFGLVPEIAALVTWLCSEECSFSTGAVFDISGGRATY